jgi:hypothetical protein
MNRRDVVKRAAGLAVVGAGGFGIGRAAGQEAKKAAPPAPEIPKEASPPPRLSRHYELPRAPSDPLLERALESPYHFMFVDEAVFEVGADAGGYAVVFPDARSPWATADGVQLAGSKLAVFRAGTGRDAFTKKGGVYWRCRTAEGKFQFKWSEDDDRIVGADGKPLGPLVLAVRDGRGTVRCYRLIIDYRC